jgi:metal-sulfur cluster biosynthetic enzyme
MSQETTSDLATSIRAALQNVIDPELGADIVSLNMVRRVDVMGDLAEIDLVLTTPGCPLAYWIVGQARQAARTVPGISDAFVQVLDEPWQPPGRSKGWQDWLAGILGNRE